MEIESPRSLADQPEMMGTKGLVMEGLAATADQTRVDVVGDERDHSWPVELVMYILDGLGDARVSCQMVVMVGAQDVQSGVLIVRDIEQSLVANEVHLVRVTKGQVGL